MRISDLFYFLRQIFFPKKHVEEESPEEREATRLELVFESVLKGLRSRESIGTAVSVVIHVAALILLSLLMLPIPPKWGGMDLLGGFNPPRIEHEDIVVKPGNLAQDENPLSENDAAPEKIIEVVEVVKQPDPTSLEAEHRGALLPNKNSTAPETVSGGTPERHSGQFAAGGGFEGRTPEGRGRSIGNGDDPGGRGNDAVEKALAWLAAHQHRKEGRLKGSWSFDFDDSCRLCSHGGPHKSRIAATSLALLPFLGAGYTHQKGPYKNIVSDGLYYLILNAIEDSRGADLSHQGSEGMYSHGLAAIVLCEAYAMSEPKTQILRDKAQKVIFFIENAQDRRGGGWRYRPGEAPGDLSVSAWQIMALKSAHLAGLDFSQQAIYDAGDFLDSVATDGGRRYLYLPESTGQRGTGPDSPKTCTATGLLLRMYLGWRPGDRMLDEGIDLVGQWGPLKDDGTQCNLYYTYYATLALHHYDGSHWMRWNSEVRDFLVRTQSIRGHEAGSWFFPDHYGDKGGRLLNTALGALILETPYRIMPLFRRPGESIP